MTRQRGAMLPMLAFLLVVVMVTTAVIVGLTERVLDRAQAQSAADAAALAGVMDGRAGADRLAAANRGTVVEFESADNWVRVVVVVDGRRAEARADRTLAFDP